MRVVTDGAKSSAYPRGCSFDATCSHWPGWRALLLEHTSLSETTTGRGLAFLTREVTTRAGAGSPRFSFQPARLNSAARESAVEAFAGATAVFTALFTVLGMTPLSIGLAAFGRRTPAIEVRVGHGSARRMNWSNIGTVKANSPCLGAKHRPRLIRLSRTGPVCVVVFPMARDTSPERYGPGPPRLAIARR